MHAKELKQFSYMLYWLTCCKLICCVSF